MNGITIQERYNEINRRIRMAAEKSGRNAEDIKLVVVTKGQSVEKIVEVIQAGAEILGENYPEETHKKIAELAGQDSLVAWHMIGHLQSRKIKYIVDDFDAIHSLDSVDRAEELNNKLLHPMQALIEVNVSGEASKGGFAVWEKSSWSEFSDTMAKFMAFSRLKFSGLMTMPPYTEDPETSRGVFRQCRQLLEFMQTRLKVPEFNQLSMGTSLDFEVAIEEGATFVRIGEAIMGPRNYSK